MLPEERLKYWLAQHLDCHFYLVGFVLVWGKDCMELEQRVQILPTFSERYTLEQGGI